MIAVLGRARRNKIFSALAELRQRRLKALGINSPFQSDATSSVDRVIRLKLAADFATSAISDPTGLVLGKQTFLDRSTILASIPEFRAVKDFGSLLGYGSLRKELSHLVRISHERVVDDFREDVRALQAYASAHGPVQVSCAVLPGPLATFYAIRENHQIEIAVDLDHASGVELMHKVARLLDDQPYDFFVATTGSFNMTLIGLHGVTQYEPVFPVCYEEQQILYDPRKSRREDALLRRVFSYRNSSGDEELRVRKDELSHVENARQDQFADLVTLIWQLDEGMAVNLWDPITRVLRHHYGWVQAASVRPYKNQVVFYQHRRFSQNSLLKISRAFQRLFVYEWNHLRKFRESMSLGLLWDDQDLRRQIWRGAGLNVLLGLPTTESKLVGDIQRAPLSRTSANGSSR